jgi:SAM-dependent methyltransferase
MRARVERRVNRFIGAGASPGSLLDIGCGTAAYSNAFARRGFTVTGIDFSAGMVAAATRLARREGSGVAFLQADFNEGLPFPDASFDHAVGVLAFDHAREPASLAAEIRRILAPGGRLYLVALTRDMNTRRGRGGGFARRARRLARRLTQRASRASVHTFDVSELRGLFATARFEVIEERAEVPGQVDLILRAA